jgi:hypothetical protein
MNTVVALTIIVMMLIGIRWSRSLLEKTRPDVLTHRRVWRYV